MAGFYLRVEKITTEGAEVFTLGEPAQQEQISLQEAIAGVFGDRPVADTARLLQEVFDLYDETDVLDAMLEFDATPFSGHLPRLTRQRQSELLRIPQVAVFTPETVAILCSVYVSNLLELIRWAKAEGNTVIVQTILAEVRAQWQYFLTLSNHIAYNLHLAKTEADWRRKQRELEVLVKYVTASLDSGMSKHEIVRQILEAEKVGDQSETAVYTAIQNLPYVQQVVAHEKWSDEDVLLGIDMTVVLAEDNKFGLDKVYLQVKSSKTGIVSAKEKIRNKNKRKPLTDAELAEELAYQRLIFINGGSAMDQEKICNFFETQLGQMAALIRGMNAQKVETDEDLRAAIRQALNR